MSKTRVSINQSKDDLNIIRAKNPKNIILSYININSIRNKLGNLSLLIHSYIYALTIAETKIDASFPHSQCVLSGFKTPYRLDASSNSGV